MSHIELPTVDVAIVNWNTSAAALRGARAFLGSEAVETRVTLVDNGSAGNERIALESARGGLDTEYGERFELLLEENLGYGTAANRALAGGEAPLVCVANADVLPTRDALGRLATVAESEPSAGMIGPTFAGPAARYHAELPGPVALLGRIFAGSFMRRDVPAPAAGAVREVGQPSGACFLMTRRAWERVGGFDEGFFLWYEDVDLARRLHDAGFRNLVVGSARVEHTAAASFRRLDGPTQQAIRLPSLERYIAKHHRRLAPVAAPLLRLSRRLRAHGAEPPAAAGRS